MTESKTKLSFEQSLMSVQRVPGGGRVTLVNFEEVCAVKDLSRVKRKMTKNDVNG